MGSVGPVGRSLGRRWLEGSTSRSWPSTTSAHPESLARLLARDSVHGPCGFEVKATDGRLQVGTHEIEVFAERHPRDLPWARLGVDVVTSPRAGSVPVILPPRTSRRAPHVIVSAPQGRGRHLRDGRQRGHFDRDVHKVISNASCTTNCLVPMVEVLDDASVSSKGFMTTVHAYTGDQRWSTGRTKTRDGPGRRRATSCPPRPARHAPPGWSCSDPGPTRRGGVARAGARTGRSPTSSCSCARVTTDEINAAFHDAARRPARRRPRLLSRRPRLHRHRRLARLVRVRRQLTMAAGRLAKVFGWYDNEWGYANRLAELDRARRPPGITAPSPGAGATGTQARSPSDAFFGEAARVTVPSSALTADPDRCGEPDSAGQASNGTIRTGHFECRATWVLALPSRSSGKPPIPRLPTTIRSACWSLAACNTTETGLPSRTRHSGVTPASANGAHHSPSSLAASVARIRAPGSQRRGHRESTGPWRGRRQHGRPCSGRVQRPTRRRGERSASRRVRRPFG